ncbi:hypothetical protein RB195_008950 [Necator americanus]|uniref:Reverse transcriptase domain-containing protein n=1 Tax=Necator americanus TaxID=51031 RepID=A0ABR1CR61_NECAM
MTTKTIHGNSQFQKPSSLRWTWESPGGGYRNEIDHIIVNKRERNPSTVINRDLFATLAGFWEDSAMDNIDEEYDRLIEHLHDCAKKAKSFKTTKRLLSLQTLELIRQCGAARAARNQELTSELARLCREVTKKDLRERKAEVLAEAAEAGRGTRRKTRMTALRNPEGTATASRRGMEKIIYDIFSDLFDSHVHLPPHHQKEDGHFIPEVLSSEIRHAIICVRKRTSPGSDRPEHLNLRQHSATLWRGSLQVSFGNARWIEKVLDEGQPCEQAGFRKGFSTIDHITVLRMLCSNFTTGISQFYKNIIIDVKRGVRHGDTISPKIFTATLENAMRKLEWDDTGVKNDGRHAERLLTEFDETCGCIGLQLNLQKTMFMRNGWVSDAPITLNGTNISECTSYVYLGRELNIMNDLTLELGRRKRAAWGVHKSIEDVVKKTRNIRLRGHLFNTTVLPALVCASET